MNFQHLPGTGVGRNVRDLFELSFFGKVRAGMKLQKINPQKFDDLVGEKDQPVIWTAAAIGRRIGRSADYVRRTLSRMDGTPVRRHQRGNYHALESELIAFWEAAGARSR